MQVHCRWRAVVSPWPQVISVGSPCLTQTTLSQSSSSSAMPSSSLSSSSQLGHPISCKPHANSHKRSRQCPTGRVFQYRVGLVIGKNTGKRLGFGSGRSVEIYDWVFSGIFCTLGHFLVFLGISGYIGYHLSFFGGSVPNIKVFF